MTGPRIGALFAGYGGLEMAVQAALGGTVAWHSEYEPPTEKNPNPDQAAARILAHHWPDVPNHGDITKIDWSQVEPVDIITGGSPCQDVSSAGKRQGMRAGTRSGLWASMITGVQILRPRLVVWENVRGVTSATADSAMEFCPGCMGDPGDGGPVLRALGRVLGDLADIGYDAWWYGLPASDVGAPHGRFREFVFAWDASQPAWGRTQLQHPGTPAGPAAELGEPAGQAAADASDVGHERGRSTRDGWAGLADDGRGAAADAAGCGCDRRAQAPLGGPGWRAPAAGPGAETAAYAAEQRCWPSRRDDRLRDARLVPLAPADTTGFPWGVQHRDCEPDCQRDRDWRTWNAQRGEWDDYGPAIRRWHDLTRCVPEPTELNSKGDGRRLAPRFTEWMQGLPAGHVTDPAIGLAPNPLPRTSQPADLVRKGITRSAQLKALGNGVVPQQAYAAAMMWLRHGQAVAV